MTRRAREKANLQQRHSSQCRRRKKCCCKIFWLQPMQIASKTRRLMMLWILLFLIRQLRQKGMGTGTRRLHCRCLSRRNHPIFLIERLITCRRHLRLASFRRLLLHRQKVVHSPQCEWRKEISLIGGQIFSSHLRLQAS